MAILFTQNHALKELPPIADDKLSDGVRLALWLYLDKHWSFKRAIDKAAEKHSVKPKIAIERMLRQVIPEEYMQDRMVNSMKRSQSHSASPSKESAIRNQKLKSMEKFAKNHLASISK